MHEVKLRASSEALTQEIAAAALPNAGVSSAPLERGTQVGRFVIIDVVGVGGMGAVYSAYDPDLSRRVAVKTLRVGAGGVDDAAHVRMVREAQAMARLSHPNVVNVFEVGEHRGSVFIAMEYVPGVTLRSWLKEKPRGWREIVQVFLQAGRGLAAAHAAHLVHRDFKPGNVLIGEDGRVRVTDFGVARADGVDPAGALPPRSAVGEPDSVNSGRYSGAISGSFSEPLTRGDVVVGTVGYMAPEQAMAKSPDARSDQFAFCVCLWEALYGKRPFIGTNAAEVTRAVLESPLPQRPRASDVPQRLHAVMVRGLDKDPAKRFASMEELLAALERDPAETWKRAAPWVAVAAALLVLGGVQLQSRARVRGACEAASGQLKGVWDDEARAQVRAAFGKVGKPFTAAALASVERALDAHAKGWSSASAEACEAALIRRDLAEDAYRLQTACLAQRRAELTALVGVLGAADDGIVERAGTVAWSLTPVASCTNLARLRADPRLTDGTRDDARVLALQALLARARSLIDAGKLADAGPVVEGAVATSRELNRHALEAEALALAGALHYAAGKFGDSADAWTKAAMAAQASGFDELLARAAIQLTTIVGFHLSRPIEGRTWDALAKATIERLGGDDVLTLERTVAVARLGSAEGKTVEVAAQHEQALELAKRLLGADHPLVWKIEFDFGSSLMAARDYGRAVPHLERALALREKEVSADHPEVALVRSTLGNAYFFGNRAAESRAAFRRALETRETLFGKESPRLVVTLNNFGDTLVKVGLYDEGIAYIERADAIAKKAYPPGHPYVHATTLTRGEAFFTAGRRDEARALIDLFLSAQPPPVAPQLAEGAAVRTLIALADGKPKDALQFAARAVAAGKQVGERSGEMLLPLLARGEAELAAGKAKEAVKTLEAAQALAEEVKPWRVYAADVSFALARARAAAKEKPDTVKLLAEGALAIYRSAEAQHAKVKAVEQFLASALPRP